jgi:hypothetical protein
VAKGYVQVVGIHYTETYAPTEKFVSIRVVIALAAMFGWLLHQMDVTTAFLYADIDGDVFFEQPERHINKRYPKHVWKLNKALYELFLYFSDRYQIQIVIVWFRIGFG